MDSSVGEQEARVGCRDIVFTTINRRVSKSKKHAWDAETLFLPLSIGDAHKREFCQLGSRCARNVKNALIFLRAMLLLRRHNNATVLLRGIKMLLLCRHIVSRL